MAHPSAKRARGVPNPMHRQLAALVNGRFDLPQENVAAMSRTREIFSNALDEYLALMDKLEQRDDPTITLVCRQVQALKTIACDAVIIPFGPTTAPIPLPTLLEISQMK